eukprot:scaffold123141_cov36-Phaeocystis_antarctica.AAC.1
MRVSTKFAPPREPGLGGRFPLRSKEPELGPKELGLGGSEPPTGVGGLDWLGVRVRVGVGVGVRVRVRARVRMR